MSKKKRAAALEAERVAAAEAAKKKTPPGSRGAWKLMDRGSSIAAGMLAGRISQTAWRITTGKKPPANGRHPEVSTGEALAWAAIGGATVEAVRVAIRRQASTYWVKSTDELPPGMKTLHKPVPQDVQLNDKEPAPAGPAPDTGRKLSRRNRGK